MRAWIVFACFLSASSSSLAANFTALDAGFFANNLNIRAAASDADRDLVSHFSGIFRVREGLHLGKEFFFELGIGSVLPWYSGFDGAVRTFRFFTPFNLVIPLFSFLRFRAGPGLEWVVVGSQVEAVELSNGTGTSTFYTPGGSRAALLAVLQGGLEARFTRSFSLMTDFIVESVASQERRSLQLAVSLGVYL